MDAEIYRIEEHQELWENRDREESPKKLDERILVSEGMREYVELVTEDGEGDDHPADLPLRPVREVHEHLDAVCVEDEEIYVDEGYAYIFDEKGEEFILTERSLGERLFFRDVRQSEYGTEEGTGEYHPIHEDFIFLDHTQIKEREDASDGYGSEEHHSTSGDHRE